MDTNGQNSPDSIKFTSHIEVHATHLSDHLEGHNGSELCHTDGEVLRDAALVGGGERKLGQAGHLRDIREQHDQEPRLLQIRDLMHTFNYMIGFEDSWVRCGF